ncbi:hypothetical protein OG905_01230 [Streptomyces sp. NBC_00322]|uniref:hypothetical protein n=1 Tax=Streptomyces sp. NBC_00322 TaxID=2975712 RepID=UPI002E2B66FC|nr:hypothetical protein [Streptomyces sp. NBC_00322]
MSASSTTMTGHGDRPGLAYAPLIRMTPRGLAECCSGTAQLSDDKNGARSGSAAEAPPARAKALWMGEAFIAATSERQEA